MKFYKRKHDMRTIRTVKFETELSSDLMIGTVGDFLETGIFEYCTERPNHWAILFPGRLCDVL